jgi:hypothetical protein
MRLLLIYPVIRSCFPIHFKDLREAQIKKTSRVWNGETSGKDGKQERENDVEETKARFAESWWDGFCILWLNWLELQINWESILPFLRYSQIKLT